jgi:Flp pilus assembly protein TadD
MEEVSAKAVRLAPADPRIWTMRSVALRLGGNLEAAFVASDEALRLDGYDSNVLSHRAALLIYAGRPREAFPVLARIRELHSGDPSAMTNHAVWECLARFLLAESEALTACERAAGFWDRWIMFSFPASIHAEAGNRERAAFWLAKVLAANPNATLERTREAGYLNSPAPAFRHATDRWVEGLRKAGLPQR